MRSDRNIDCELLYRDLLLTHGQRIRRYCVTHTDSPEEAKDLLQEIAYTVWKSCASLRSVRSSFAQRQWLNRLMRSVAANYYQRQRLRTVPLEVAGEVPGDMDGDSELIETLMEHLDEEERALVQALREGYTNGEIARRFGISDNALSQRKRRIIKKMYKIYEKYYA